MYNATAVFAGIERDEDGNLFEYTHATMSDGVKIALAISYPKEFEPSGEGKKWPVIMEMSGYPWQTKPPSHEGYGGLYVAINVSLRGTGASGGTFSFMSDRSIRDGHELIEQWIVKQPWSNGKVGITGHSWSGLTGFRIAATNPPHLTTLVVSGLFDDSIRGLAGIGGIRNVGFPMQWVSNFNRTDGVFGSDQAAIENRDLDESEHREIQKNRENPPTGHVFRKGHQLMLTVSRPPENDPVPYPWGRRKKAIIKSGSFKYESNQPDSTVTIHQSSELPSSILLPLMPTLPPISKNRPALIELLWDHKE